MISNELQPKAFVTSPEIRVEPLSSPTIRLTPQTSPGIRVEVSKPGKTLVSVRPNTITVLALPKGKIGDWSLKSVILVRIRRTRKEFLATTWLEGIEEYGAAEGETEAITDLVISLGEYREALERREAALGDSARRELDCLRRLIERAQ